MSTITTDLSSAYSSSQDDPDYIRTSFLSTNFSRACPAIEARFPFVQTLYLTKIFRGIITPKGLVWLDHDREDMTPADSNDLSHLLYCFEVYGQIVVMFAADGETNPNLEGSGSGRRGGGGGSGGEGVGDVEDLQRALADYRIRVLKLAKECTFESLREWHQRFVGEQMRLGQDSAAGWRAAREELTGVLRRKM